MSHPVLQGAALSYRALFTWLNPLGYLSSRLIRPIGLAVTFAAVSSHYGGSVARTLVGASLLACAHAVIYGLALAVANERSFGTLDLWLASPQNTLAAICQRGLPHLVDGFLGGLITYLVCGLLYGVLPVPLHTFAGALILVLVSAFGMGVLTAGIALLVKDVFTTPNLAHLLLMVFSGTLMSTEALPSPLRPVSEAFPISHVAAYLSGPVGRGPGLLESAVGEVAVGLVWFAGGALLVQIFLRRGSRG
ncbi:ABC transporter permease [Streptomyces poriferorum]|uniref:ABC transporter permease n=1 Tax=Streptomyces poriferorum TaxID=2798799 RepID=A0ABY9IFZ4_9ACTN|nr:MULTISPECIES: ABC transporter permease [unclassified Streptomyces]WSQ41572.1 ABC transporter permease [Streptomyces sp. NBC_01220]MDP5315765.1 ABC transporter permease [Streptomyces sp. Alt4]WLQ53114.1 ABC transporter permease [Streptomyces sp. Alt1]WLQ54125.1 ABC transporter permease [Streptomyces sp. Alt2]WSI68006.1 ABC transporter permease [Streptomyces sp. NBC_01336]